MQFSFDMRHQLLRRQREYSDGLNRAWDIAQMSHLLNTPLGRQPAADFGIDTEKTQLDIGGYSVVAAVSSVDALVKNLSVDIVIGELDGQIDLPHRLSVDIPVTSARLLLDAKDLLSDTGVQLQFSKMASDWLCVGFEKNNYQNADSVFGQLRSLGLGSKSEIIQDSSVRQNFVSTLTRLAEQRHVMVHRLGDESRLLVEGTIGDRSRVGPIQRKELQHLLEGGSSILEHIKRLASS